jgi:hypothetical protein
VYRTVTWQTYLRQAIRKLEDLLPRSYTAARRYSNYISSASTVHNSSRRPPRTPETSQHLSWNSIGRLQASASTAESRARFPQNLTSTLSMCPLAVPSPVWTSGKRLAHRPQTTNTRFFHISFLLTSYSWWRFPKDKNKDRWCAVRRAGCHQKAFDSHAC